VLKGRWRRSDKECVAADDVHASPDAHDLARRADVSSVWIPSQSPHTLYRKYLHLKKPCMVLKSACSSTDAFVRFQAVMLIRRRAGIKAR
jgi:hypothetical protein